MLKFRPGKYKPEIVLTDTPVSRFVKKIIEERDFLIEKRIGKIENDVVIALGKLKESFIQVPLRTEMGWCKWFMQDQIDDQITIIFPGQSSTHYKKYSEEREKLREYCGKVIAGTWDFGQKVIN